MRWLVIGLAAILLAPLSWAQAGTEDEAGPPRKMHSEMKGHGGMHMAEKLDLTKEQQMKIQQIMTEQREAMKPLREKMKTLRKDLKDLVDKKAGDRELTKTIDAIKDTAEKMRVTAQKFRERHDAVLTPLQKAKAMLGAGKGMRERAKKADAPKECPYKKGEKKTD